MIVAILACYTGNPEEGERLVAPNQVVRQALR